MTFTGLSNFQRTKVLQLKTNKGVTLIELSIALVISSILIAGLYRVFIGQHKTYTVQEQVVDMQQNARVGINRMMSEIRMAGFGNVSMVLPVQFVAYGQTRTFNNVLNLDTPFAGSFTIITATGDFATITSITLPNKVTLNKLKDSQGDPLFDTGNRKCISIGGLESYTITNIQGTTLTLSGNLVYNHPINTPVFPIRAISYQVVSEEVSEDWKFTLKRDENIGGGRQPLADNIENIQFEYFDAQGNPTVTPANIRMVKVTVNARTDMPDPQFKGGDGYRRRQIASNIYLRNMGLSP
jgi:prepilin-type N-terminal cleavage/methylation domain-containing protein